MAPFSDILLHTDTQPHPSTDIVREGFKFFGALITPTERKAAGVAPLPKSAEEGFTPSISLSSYPS